MTLMVGRKVSVTKLIHSADIRETVESFGREHNMSDNYIHQIEAFIRAQLSEDIGK